MMYDISETGCCVLRTTGQVTRVRAVVTQLATKSVKKSNSLLQAFRVGDSARYAGECFAWE